MTSTPDDHDPGPEPLPGALEGAAGAAAASRLEGRFQYAKYHTKGGHGFAAEDANQVVDELLGREVDLIGRNNAANGPDRVVDSVAVQTKYFKSAKSTVRSAFDSASGTYRYGTQVLEVPADQHAEAVRLFRKRIESGQVPGVTDPKDAGRLVRKGQVTYRQARNIARAGNLDSLRFDAKTQAVSSVHACAISFGIIYARARWSGLSNREAVRSAIASGMQVGATTFIAGIVTAQILRTEAAAVGTVAARNGARLIAGSRAGNAAMQNIAAASLRRPVYGAAATNHVAKLMRTNVITGAVTTTLLTAPDFYRAAFEGSTSWTQFTKNLAVNASGVGGGLGGWAAGAAAGGAVGGPPGALLGSLVGGLGGGLGGSMLSKRFVDCLAEDDAVALLRIVRREAEHVAFEHMLSEDELERFARKVGKKIDPAWLRRMYRSGGKKHRKRFARKRLRKIAFKIAKARPSVTAPQLSAIEAEVHELTSPA